MAEEILAHLVIFQNAILDVININLIRIIKMDPITAIAIATSAFKAIKTGFTVGRDLESMTGDLSRWMGAMGDIKEADRKARNPSVFKTYLAKGSVEKEAIEAFTAKKKAIEMENELKTFINLTYGPNAWNQLLQLQSEIRKGREKEKERLEELKELAYHIFLGTFIISLLCGIVTFVFINI